MGWLRWRRLFKENPRQSQVAKSDVFLEGNAFLRLAVPLAMAQLAQAAVGFVDTIMMGRLGTTVLAAGGLASNTLQMVLAVSSGLVMSVGVLAAEAYGSGDKVRVEQLARQGLGLCLLLTLPATALLWQMTPILRWLQQSEELGGLAQQYFSWVSIGIFPWLGFAMLRGYVSAFSLANVVTVIVIVGTLFNIAGNYILGFGKLGFPRMELAGLGLSSGLSFWLMFGLFLAYIMRHPQMGRYRFWRHWQRLNLSTLKRMVALGLPIAATVALEFGLFLSVTYLVGSLGSEKLAAHQIAFQTAVLVFMLPLGMSYAVTTRVGLWMGKGDQVGARRAGYVAMAIAAVVLSVVAIALITYRRAVIGLFIDLQDPQNAAVIALAMNLLLVSAVAQTIDAVQRMALSGLHGLQDTQIPMLICAVTFWGIGLTSGYLLCFWAGWGTMGLWIGQYSGVALGGVIFVWRFHRLTR